MGQARRFLAEAHGHPLEALFTLAVTTGMRQGELIGLRWRDVDWATRRAFVRHTLVRLHGRWWLGEPTTARSERSIELTDATLDVLRAHRDRQAGVVGTAGRQIAAGMDGRTRTGTQTPPWLLDQLLTAKQGLRAVTVDTAHALGDEARRGHLAPGTLGDVTILSGDVTTATPDEIRATTVIATIVGGIPGYCADREICFPLGD